MVIMDMVGSAEALFGLMAGDKAWPAIKKAARSDDEAASAEHEDMLVESRRYLKTNVQALRLTGWTFEALGIWSHIDITAAEGIGGPMIIAEYDMNPNLALLITPNTVKAYKDPIAEACRLYDHMLYEAYMRIVLCATRFPVIQRPELPNTYKFFKHWIDMFMDALPIEELARTSTIFGKAPEYALFNIMSETCRATIDDRVGRMVLSPPNYSVPAIGEYPFGLFRYRSLFKGIFPNTFTMTPEMAKIIGFNDSYICIPAEEAV